MHWISLSSWIIRSFYILYLSFLCSVSRFFMFCIWPDTGYRKGQISGQICSYVFIKEDRKLSDCGKRLHKLPDNLIQENEKSQLTDTPLVRKIWSERKLLSPSRYRLTGQSCAVLPAMNLWQRRHITTPGSLRQLQLAELKQISGQLNRK